MSSIPLPRFEATYPVSLEAQGSSWTCQTENLSQSGLKIRGYHTLPFHPGSRLEIALRYDELNPGHEELKFEAEIIWVRGSDAGLKIVAHPHPASASLYENLISGFEALHAFAGRASLAIAG